MKPGIWSPREELTAAQISMGPGGTPTPPSTPRALPAPQVLPRPKLHVDQGPSLGASLDTVPALSSPGAAPTPDSSVFPLHPASAALVPAALPSGEGEDPVLSGEDRAPT